MSRSNAATHDEPKWQPFRLEFHIDHSVKRQPKAALHENALDRYFRTKSADLENTHHRLTRNHNKTGAIFMDQPDDGPIFWGVAGSGSADGHRVAVDLGLRSALLHYGDMSVPGIAGASFVRQIVWPCLALAIDAEMPGRRGLVSKARFATAIEALACKLWIEMNPNSSSGERKGRVAGTRSLQAKGWSFKDLGPTQGFVSNPRRRAATRTLPEQGGLGFAQGAQRLEGMVLTALGKELTDGLLDTSTSRSTLRDWLKNWPSKTDEPTNSTKRQLSTALNPFDPTERERHAVMISLVRTNADEGRRKRLVDLLISRLEEPTFDIERDLLQQLPVHQIEEIRTAWAFRKLLTSCQRLLRAIASGLSTPGARKPINLFLNNGCAQVAERAREDARTFLERIEGKPGLGHRDAVAFAQLLNDGDDETAVAAVVRRAERLIHIDDDVLRRGPAWTDGWLDDQDILDPEKEGQVAHDLPPRFDGLISLLKDCQGLPA